MSDLTILHVNDMHSNFHSLKTQTNFMMARRKELEELGHTVWAVDLGDLIDRVHPLVEAKNGQIASTILNQQKIDFVTLGNNEGTAYTPEELEGAYKEKDFKVVISNVKWQSTGETPPYATEIQFEKIDQCSIAILGLTASYPESYEPNGYWIEDPLKTLERLVPRLASEGHQIILLSHLGIDLDTLIAESYPEIKVILGAHTHHLFKEGKRVNQTLLTGGFKYGTYIGELHLKTKKEKLIPLEESMIEVETLKEDPAADEGKIYLKEGIKLLKENIVLRQIPDYSVRDLAQLSLEAMIRQTGIPIAFTYTGLFVHEFKKGALTKFDLHDCMPHPIHLNNSQFSVKNFKQLLRVFEEQQPELLEKAIRGYGFRGKLFGEILYTGFSKKGEEIIVDGKVLADDEIIKVHVHTERPGEVMNYGQRFGSLMKVKVDNMRLQHEEVLKTDYTAKVKEAAQKQKAEYGIVAVAAGEGVQELFKSMGVTTIINGGQTMNPSTEDILQAVKEAHAEKVIVLPNNKNIQMAANQAAEVSEDAAVAVVATRTISEGLASLLAFNPEASLEDNQAAMSEQMALVSSGQITNAVRDTNIDGVEIKKDDFMGIVDGKILVSISDRKEATLATIDKMIDDDSEILTIIYGEDADASEVEEITEAVEAKYPDVEVEVHEGNQPVYTYLLSVE